MPSLRSTNDWETIREEKGQHDRTRREPLDHVKRNFATAWKGIAHRSEQVSTSRIKIGRYQPTPREEGTIHPRKEVAIATRGRDDQLAEE